MRAAIGIFERAGIRFWATLQLRYGYSQTTAFFTLAGVGRSLGLLAAVVAGWNQWWLSQVPSLLVGTFCTWAGLLGIAGVNRFRSRSGN